MRHSGFTLVELLVTMSLVAILAAVAVPRFTDAISKAKATEVQMAFSVIAKAQHVYNMETDRYAMASTPEEFLSELGVEMKTYKYFNFVTGPEYQQLVADIAVEEIPLVMDGFWIRGDLKSPFGYLDGDEVVFYNYCSITHEEKASTVDPVLAHYLQNYLFKINGTPVPEGNLGLGEVGGGSEPVAPNPTPNPTPDPTPTPDPEDTSNNGHNIEDHDNKGHGNDEDGYDEDNPGASMGTNKGGK